jgi:hypothetical protein
LDLPLFLAAAFEMPVSFQNLKISLNEHSGTKRKKLDSIIDQATD